MHTGEDIHDGMVTRIRKVRRQLDREEQRIDSLQQQLAESGERRCATLRALAEFHLPGMTEDAIAGTLSDMEAGIRAIFDEKKDRLSEVERLIPEQRGTLAEAEAALVVVTRALNETGAERARLAHIVFEELQTMPRWQSLFAQAQRLEARVAASGKRLEAAEREQTDKLPAYERDPLFAYLTRRNFGTARAAGTAITRGLDRWVAGVIEYADARAKYDFLKELPDHAAAVLAEDHAALAAAVPPLARVESEVVDRNGLTPVLERGERLYGEREDARRALREAETTLRDLTGEFAALHDERGSYYESAIDGLEAYLDGRTPEELAAMARASGDPRDDVHVADLQEIDDQLAELRTDLANAKDERDSIADRLAGLEDLRDQFETDDWNGRRSRFDDGLDINALLLGYLAGSHSHGHVHRVLGRSQHFVPIGDSFGEGGFGSGGFGGGGFGGGGFSSGGGFGGGGGGGFSTGGGF